MAPTIPGASGRATVLQQPDLDSPYSRVKSGNQESPCPCPASPVATSRSTRRAPSSAVTSSIGSQFCNLSTEYEQQPGVFYYWQKQAFENLAGAFQPAVTTSSREKDLEREVEALKARVAKKDAVIASISEEYVTLK